MGNVDMTPCITNLGTKWGEYWDSCPSCCTSGEELKVPIGWGFLELLWTLWTGGKGSFVYPVA